MKCGHCSSPIPEDANEQMLQFMPTDMEGHISGHIWVADQAGLPQVIVRSETTQEITLKYASKDDETMVYEETQELYDINQSFSIDPPVTVEFPPNSDLHHRASV